LPLEAIRIELLLPAFGLVLARVAGLVMGVPVLSAASIPAVAKVWLVATLSLMTFPIVMPLLPQSLTLLQVASGMVGEFVVGEILGLAASVVFLSAEVAGKMVSHQSGLALGEVYNPVSDATSTELDQVWYFAALMIFMALRGHVAVIDVLMGSFRQVPPMMMFVDGAMTECVQGLLRSVFDVALRLAGPAILALLLTSLIMGVLTKTMPQLNVLSVGFSFKIAVALFMVAVTISFSYDLLSDTLFDGLDQVGSLFEYASRKVSHGI
jgi:flagellar biosynthetic protein FliR